MSAIIEAEAVQRDMLLDAEIDLAEMYVSPPPSLPHDPDAAEAARREEWEVEQYQRQVEESMKREWKRQGVW